MMSCEQKDKSMAEVYDEYVRSKVIQIPQVRPKIDAFCFCFLYFLVWEGKETGGGTNSKWGSIKFPCQENYTLVVLCKLIG